MAVILAIEDHDEVLTMLSVIFERHHMLLAPDSTSGIRMAKDLKPDLILLDVGMPDIDGLDVCRILREDADTASTPIILVTAHIEVVADPSIWRGAGADAAIQKPFSPARLVAEAERLLSERARPR